MILVRQKLQFSSPHSSSKLTSPCLQASLQFMANYVTLEPLSMGGLLESGSRGRVCQGLEGKTVNLLWVVETSDTRHTRAGEASRERVSSCNLAAMTLRPALDDWCHGRCRIRTCTSKRAHQGQALSSRPEPGCLQLIACDSFHTGAVAKLTACE